MLRNHTRGTNNNYRSMNNFGNTSYYSEVSNPLTYCINDTIEKNFLHGGNAYIYGQNSRQCQSFLSDYCAQHWDSACEVASNNKNQFLPNNLANSNIGSRTYNYTGMTSGNSLIRNTASKKYLVAMGNCVEKYEPFDPTVADSPMIRFWSSDTGTNDCVPVYAVDPKTIDNDVVMHKLLDNPNIAMDILINIYNNHKNLGNLEDLKGTRLHTFFESNPQIFHK